LVKKKLNILICTAGGRAPGKELGFGHIYRCLNLGMRLKPNKIYFLVEDYGNVKQVIRKKGFKKIYSLPKGIDVKTEIMKTLQFIKKEKIDLLILDKYNLSLKLIKELNKSLKIVIFSDLEKFDFPGNLVINGFVGFKDQIINNKYGVKTLLGPSYQVVTKGSSKKNSKNPKYDLLATFGGFDENNIIELLLNQLTKFGRKINCKIILGPGTIKSKKISLVESKLGKSVTIINQTKNMIEEIRNTKYGLCSGGITTYEFASHGIPFGILCQVKHQLKTAREWEKLNLATNLGLVNKKSDKKIESFLNIVLMKKIKKRTIYPKLKNNATEKVVKEILKLI